MLGVLFRSDWDLPSSKLCIPTERYILAGSALSDMPIDRAALKWFRRAPRLVVSCPIGRARSVLAIQNAVRYAESACSADPILGMRLRRPQSG